MARYGVAASLIRVLYECMVMMEVLYGLMDWWGQKDLQYVICFDPARKVLLVLSVLICT